MGIDLLAIWKKIAKTLNFNGVLKVARTEDWMMSREISVVLAISLFIPAFFVGGYFFYSYMGLRQAEEIVRGLEVKGRRFEKILEAKKAFKERYGRADENFLANRVETIQPLQKDTDLLKSVVSSKANVSSCPFLEERLEKFCKGENTISFALTFEREGSSYKESKWKLRRPVLMEFKELTKLLALIEGIDIGDESLDVSLRPQLTVEKLHIRREKNPFLDLQEPVMFEGSDVLFEGDEESHLFSVDLEILQRIPKQAALVSRV